MAKRKTYDWEAIEKEFRAGQLSIREIAKIHGCSDTAIRFKMKAMGVDRDLSGRVAAKVKADLVRNRLRTANPQSEKETINEAAARAVEVVRSHRSRIKTGGKVVEMLFAQLSDVTENRAEIESEIESETKDDPNPSRKNTMLRAIGLQANASTAVSLSLALKNLIGLDRQTFNLDEGAGEEDKLSEIKIVGVLPQ